MDAGVIGLLAHLSHGFQRLAVWFEVRAGVGLLHVTLSVIAVAVLWRLYLAVTLDRHEVRRRKRLLEDLREFIHDAVAANREKLERLEQRRLEVHAWRHVSSPPSKN